MKRPILFNIVLITLMALVLSGCGARRQYNLQVKGNTNSLDSLEDMHVVRVTKNKDEKNVSRLRLTQIDEIGLSVGAQAALAHRAKQINAVLARHEKTLDQVFNFRGMIIEKHVLPPVLDEGRDTLNLTDDTTIRLSDRIYKIVKQARFVTNPPHWRDYLWMDFSTPESPHRALLPRSTLERDHWKAAVQKGWDQGIAQADAIYQENIARLKRDYVGMALYRKLLAQRVVSQPYVASSSLGVTGDGHKVRVGDKVLRITALPQLDTHSERWKAVVMNE